MELAPLGRTSLELSRIGFGCAAIGGYDYGPADDQESVAAVHAAVDAGVTFFDTADIYGLGHAEEILARALGPRARDVVIATKVGVRWDESGRTRRDLSPGWVVQALEQSLRRLGVDCIPLYQMHWADESTPIEDTMAALERCRTAGKVRFLGCCNFPSELIDRAQTVGRLEAIQLPFSLGQQEWRAVADRSRDHHGMSVLCYNPLAQGLFAGRYSRESGFRPDDLRSRSALFQGQQLERNLAILDRLRLVAQRLGRTPAQVALRWILDQPGISSAIAGARRAAQIQDNAGAVGWHLAPATAHFLTQGQETDEQAQDSN